MIATGWDENGVDTKGHERIGRIMEFKEFTTLIVVMVMYETLY